MPGVSLTTELRAEYETLFASGQPREIHRDEAQALALRLLNQQSRYDDVAATTGVPWHFVGVVHCLESSLNFQRHLHNGDPLTEKTVHVPKGRPASGSPPFTWEESASDALTLLKLNEWTDWTVSGTLYKLEAYNGFGYRLHHPEVKSPYLWSYSEHYSSGKYVGDGSFDPTAVSKQCGGAVLLRWLVDQGHVTFTQV